MDQLEDPIAVARALHDSGDGVAASQDGWFRAVVHHAPVLVMVLDGQGRCRYANPDCHQSGDSSHVGDGNGQPMDLDPRSPGRGLQGLHRRLAPDAAEALHTRTPVRRTLSYETDHELRHVQAVTFPIDGGDPAGEVGIVALDVTDTVRLRHALGIADDRSRGVFDRATLPMLITGADRRIRDCNPALAQFLGYRPSELRGKAVSELFDSSHQRASDVWTVGESSPPFRHSRTTLLASDGRPLPVRLTVSAVRRADGTVQHHLGFVEPLNPAQEPPEAGARELGELLPVEVAVLEGLAAGYSHVQIAAKLHFSRQGVDYHLDKLRRKLAAPSRAAIVSRAFTLGLFVPGQWPPRIDQAHRADSERDLWPESIRAAAAGT
jgi:PAS domain S-box-containing protein